MWQVKVIDLNSKQSFTRVSDESTLYKAEWDVLAKLYLLRPNASFIVTDIQPL